LVVSPVGARRVVVKGGNPTSNKPPADDPDAEPVDDGEHSEVAEEMADLSAAAPPTSPEQRRPGFFRRLFSCFRS
jgi:hypothetical protein